jgi:hypothetical protein
LVTAVTAAALLGAACAVRALDVGSDEQPLPLEAGPSDAGPEADAEAGPTLLEALAARCAAPSGSPDYFTSAAELTQRLRGRWFYCPQSSNWFTPPDGIDFELAASGTFAYLHVDAAHDTLVASTDPNESGDVLYQAPVGGFMDAGTEGGVEGDVPIDDTFPRNGLSVALVRADYNFFFVPVFESGPRRMLLRELGDNPAQGIFVPID